MMAHVAIAKEETDSNPNENDELEVLWNEALASINREDRVMENTRDFQWPSIMAIGHWFLNTNQSYCFQSSEDVLENRGKVLCKNGFICKVKVSWLDHGFSGLYKQSNLGLMRLSSAMGPVQGIPWAFGNFAKAVLFPCVAIKVLRKSKHSGNILFGSRKTGQQSDNFFAHSVATVLSEDIPFALGWILAAFRMYTSYPTQLGLSDFAKYDHNGDEEPAPSFPWTLTLVAREPMKELSFPQIISIPPNTVIYDIFAFANPGSVGLEKGLVRVGEIETVSPMIPSVRDNGIVFKHQLREEDYALRPEWLDDLTRVHSSVGPAYFDDLISRGHFDGR